MYAYMQYILDFRDRHIRQKHNLYDKLNLSLSTTTYQVAQDNKKYIKK